MKVDHGQYADLIETEYGLTIKLNDDGKDEINGIINHALLHDNCPDLSVLADLLDDFTSNGWQWIYPRDIGALTSDTTPVIGYDVEITDDGEVIPHGPIYWHERYQIECAYEALRTKGEVFFLRGNEDTDV